nr:hypothetical protein [Pedobacter suwonensis]
MKQQRFHNHEAAPVYVAAYFVFNAPVDRFGTVNTFTVRIGDYFERTIPLIGIIKMDANGKIPFKDMKRWLNGELIMFSGIRSISRNFRVMVNRNG